MNLILTAMCFLLLIFMLIFTAGGAFLIWRVKKANGKPKEHEPPGLSHRERTQYENLINYDGTGRGQKGIEN